MGKDSAVMQNTNYKLLDLMKFICAFLVIGIHTRPFQIVSDVADKLFYYNISNWDNILHILKDLSPAIEGWKHNVFDC